MTFVDPSARFVIILANPARTYEAIAEPSRDGLWRVVVLDGGHWRPFAEVIDTATETNQYFASIE